MEKLPQKIKETLYEVLQLLRGKVEKEVEDFNKIKEKLYEDYSKYVEYLRRLENTTRVLSSLFEDALKFFGFLMDVASIAKNLVDVDDLILLRFLLSSLLESLLHVNDVISESFKHLDKLNEIEKSLNSMVNDVKSLINVFHGIRNEIRKQIEDIRGRLEELNREVLK
ncbi:MAG: hypothetical protein ACTSV7_00990 [Candidatus Baldrarchaeia archaeon]|nr:hypothetical protein [Candidatus Baldrarchaeota archaeon]